MKKVVLAYSGGLDTSCCVRWLKDKGFDVVCFMADLGQGENFKLLKKRAIKTGASKVYVKDLKNEFVKDFILPTLKANAIYEGKYYLATALGRPLITKYLVDIAHKEKAKAIAHGCTGIGNDQIRIEGATRLLDPKLKIVAPVKIWKLKSREEEIDYAKEKKIPIDVTKKKIYSIDKNLWGVSIECGILEDPWREPPKDAYQMSLDPQKAASKPQYIEIYFEKGEPKKINGKSYPLIELISKLNKIAGLHGIGRSDSIENRVIGLKSREIYEAPAAAVLVAAHKELESMVLDGKTQHEKELIAIKYAELIYAGLWFSKQKQFLDKIINKTQNKVTGTVKLKLYKGNCIPVGRKSKYSLYKRELVTYSSK
ncbi:MAG: argininosuccinate synthase [Candidatus Omnitrophica bacterium]|nr:argininosuccinate synthase [Candidatus Omnitrophota bacterium]